MGRRLGVAGVIAVFGRMGPGGLLLKYVGSAVGNWEGGGLRMEGKVILTTSGTDNDSLNSTSSVGGTGATPTTTPTTNRNTRRDIKGDGI